jgi:hypothetical protein
MSLPHEQSAKSGVTPVQTAPLQPGASSQRDSSIMYRQDQVAKQQSMNKQYSGGKRGRSKKSKKYRKSKRHRGGSSTGIVVPSFSTPGPPVSAGNQSATGTSMSTNSTDLQGKADGSCDKCIGDASQTPHCQSGACNPQAGGGQKGGSCSSCGDNGLIPVGKTWGCLSGGGKRKTKKFKKHYMWNTKGKRYTAKTYKQHLRGAKLGHTHQKPRKSRKSKRKH